MSSEISAIILAAGRGRRLGKSIQGPKILLDFDGESLLSRHISALQTHGITDITLTVGYRWQAIAQEVVRLGVTDRIRLIYNERYREGSLVSLWVQQDRLRSGIPILLMDGDVLYDDRMIARLLAAPAENVLLVDRHIEPDDSEAMKICFRAGAIVDFRKEPEWAHDWHGESVGFFRFSSGMSAALADRCAWHVERGETGLEYEEAIRDLILASPRSFAAADISDLPWTEIDFSADIVHAKRDILPRLIDRSRSPYESARRAFQADQAANNIGAPAYPPSFARPLQLDRPRA